jgi:pimeloyl-ACP methyl ester carboxylesterase
VSNIVLILVVSVFMLVMMFVMRNDELKDLTDAERKTAPGSFARLSDGFVRYDVSGDATGGTAVLVHGFSTYSFTWDNTVHAIAAAGHRVLRYDLYGRGYSDRPETEYTKDLFDR